MKKYCSDSLYICIRLNVIHFNYKIIQFNILIHKHSFILLDKCLIFDIHFLRIYYENKYIEYKQ